MADVAGLSLSFEFNFKIVQAVAWCYYSAVTLLQNEYNSINRLPNKTAAQNDHNVQLQMSFVCAWQVVLI